MTTACMTRLISVRESILKFIDRYIVALHPVTSTDWIDWLRYPGGYIRAERVLREIEAKKEIKMEESAYRVRRSKDGREFEIMEGRWIFARTDERINAARILGMLRNDEIVQDIVENEVRNATGDEEEKNKIEWENSE